MDAYSAETALTSSVKGQREALLFVFLALRVLSVKTIKYPRQRGRLLKFTPSVDDVKAFLSSLCGP